MRILSAIFFVCCFYPTLAQQVSLVEARYAEEWSIDTLTRQRGYDTVVLRINGQRSSYWSRNQYFRDSLLALPDGRVQFMKMVTQLVETRGQASLYSNLGEYIYRFGDSTYTRATLALGTSNVPVEIIERTEIPEWHLIDSCKTIGSHLCYLAEADFRGRHWIAWYAPEVPLSHGPWKLCGLPGLIFETYDQSNDYHYRLVGLHTVVGADVEMLNLRNYKYRPIDRLEYLRKMADYMRIAMSEQVQISSGDKELSEMFSSEKPIIRRDFRERDYVQKSVMR